MNLFRGLFRRIRVMYYSTYTTRSHPQDPAHCFVFRHAGCHFESNVQANTKRLNMQQHT